MPGKDWRQTRPHTHHDKTAGSRWGWGQLLELIRRGRNRAQPLADKHTAHGTHMLAWIYLCLHRKRVISSTELGRNPGRAGGCSGLTAAGLSEHLGMVLLEEKAISEIIYLTGKKPVHYSSLEFLWIKSYHSTSFASSALSSLPDDPQSSVLCWGMILGEAQALPRPSCSHSSWTNLLQRHLMKLHLRNLVAPDHPFGAVLNWGQTPHCKWSNSH